MGGNCHAIVMNKHSAKAYNSCAGTIKIKDSVMTRRPHQEHDEQSEASSPFPAEVIHDARVQARNDRLAHERMSVPEHKRAAYDGYMANPSRNVQLDAAAEHWAVLMQDAMHKNAKLKIADIAGRALEELEPYRTSDVKHMAPHIIRYWEHGEQFRIWYQERAKQAKKPASPIVDEGPFVRMDIAESAQRWKEKLAPVIAAVASGVQIPNIDSVVDDVLKKDIEVNFPVKPHLRIPQVATQLAADWPEGAAFINAWMERTSSQRAEAREDWARKVNTRLMPPDDEKSL